MNLEFDITQPFNEDMTHFTSIQRKMIGKQIDVVSKSLLNGRTAFNENSSVPYSFRLKGGLESSLFLIKADQDNCVVAAVDDDPIYDRILVTLFRVVDKNEAHNVYRTVGEVIYSKLGILENQTNGRN